MRRVSRILPVFLLFLALVGCQKSVLQPVAPEAPDAPQAIDIGNSSSHGLAVPSEIDPTGQTDVTDQLQEFLSSVPDGATIVFPPKATFRVEGSLLLIGRQGLTIEGNGAMVFATTDGSQIVPPTRLKHKWPRKRAHLIFDGGGNIVVRDLEIRGAHPNPGADGEYVAALEGQHGIVLRGVQGAEIDRVRITDVYGDFMYLGGGVTDSVRQWTRNVHIHDSHFERNGRQGFGITGAEDVLIEDNYIGEVKRTALDVEPNGNGGGAIGLTVRDNHFGAIHGHWLAAHGKVGTVRDITLERNVLNAKMRVSTNSIGPRRSNFRIVDNVSDRMVGSPAPLMTLHLIDGLEVRGNRHPLNKWREMTGVYVTESCDVTVEGNSFVGAQKEYEILPYAGC
jgi:hypothetical protein